MTVDPGPRRRILALGDDERDSRAVATIMDGGQVTSAKNLALHADVEDVMRLEDVGQDLEKAAQARPSPAHEGVDDLDAPSLIRVWRGKRDNPVKRDRCEPACT
jgi:hypothetical protein